MLRDAIDLVEQGEVTRDAERCQQGQNVGVKPPAVVVEVIARRRRRGEPKVPGKRPLLLGLRWTVERTNSWLSNHGQLRRNTDRRTAHRLAQLALAITLIITGKLIDWHDRWNRP